MVNKKVVKAWDAIEKAVNGFEPLEVGALACIFIDFAAEKAEMQSEDFVEMILPAIRSVNNSMGSLNE